MNRKETGFWVLSSLGMACPSLCSLTSNFLSGQKDVEIVRSASGVEGMLKSSREELEGKKSPLSPPKKKIAITFGETASLSSSIVSKNV